ncbi:response regulator [Paenibacillus filicis]|uniref:Response regulator n=1 Tax=Paenibacillus gyeongsangnamensis TaxID=3388067 RepID=A0ABT4QAF8_9BACL|nr:response regulator [Paenibacillus filicis]MCZ8513874.1 response regulator [Paenibacillus filicis]
MKICVADDEKAVRQSIINKLRSIDPLAVIYDVGFGHASLEQILLVQPDLVFLDIRMPELDGLELLGEIKHAYPRIQAVMLTGFGEFEYARKALQLGAADYLLKPADRGQLKAIVEKVKSDMEACFIQELEPYLDKLSDKYIFVDVMQCPNISLWFDERQAKQVIFADSLDLLAGANEQISEEMLFSFSVNNDYAGIVVKSDGRHGIEFHTKNEFFHMFQQGMVQWETGRFFGGCSSIRPLNHSDNMKHAIQLRKSILASAKGTDYKNLESCVNEWLDCVYKLELRELKKQCVSLMALLDEGLASKEEFIVLEEEKVHYWTQWVEQYKTWLKLKERIRKFILDGVRALSFTDHQPNLGWFEQALGWIDSNRDPNATLESVAAAVGVHPVTLSRIFKQRTGMNFVKFLVKRKMQLSRRLLLSTDKTVRQIAEDIGYMDYRYFRNLFKKEFDMMPAEYRSQKGVALNDDALQ